MSGGEAAAVVAAQYGAAQWPVEWEETVRQSSTIFNRETSRRLIVLFPFVFEPSFNFL